jgi:pimeloyl-ACP methyl ester carboxylesterase
MVDLKHAIEYAKSYYYNLEQIKIIKTYLIGVSAGGNLVLLALQEHFIEPDGAIAISPPTLLEDSVFLNNMISNNLTFNYVVDQCFQKNELRKFTIQRNKLLETGIPILITHGTNDKIVPIKHSKYLVENSPANSNIKLVEFPFEGHNYTNTKDSLLKIILQFLKQK